jgi:hypothetical protein
MDTVIYFNLSNITSCVLIGTIGETLSGAYQEFADFVNSRPNICKYCFRKNSFPDFLQYCPIFLLRPGAFN